MKERWIPKCQLKVEYPVEVVDKEGKKNVNFECLRGDEHKSYSNAIECGIDYWRRSIRRQTAYLLKKWMEWIYSEYIFRLLIFVFEKWRVRRLLVAAIFEWEYFWWCCTHGWPHCEINALRSYDVRYIWNKYLIFFIFFIYTVWVNCFRWYFRFLSGNTNTSHKISLIPFKRWACK